MKTEAMTAQGIKRHLASFAANRHLHAYLLDGNPRHIAEAWRDFREYRIPPDESMLRWLDVLAQAVLNPPRARRRPKENTVRDLEIWRVVSIKKERNQAQGLPVNLDEIYQHAGRGRVPVGRGSGRYRNDMKPEAVKLIYSRVQKMLADPYYAPRAFRKP